MKTNNNNNTKTTHNNTNDNYSVNAKEEKNNNTKIKKKSKIVHLNDLKNFNIIIILLITFSQEVTSEDYSLHRCDAPTQQSIFENLPQCMARPSLVDMRHHFADHHDIIQVCLIKINLPTITHSQ